MTIVNNVKIVFNHGKFDYVSIPENVKYNEALLTEHCPILHEEIKNPIILNSGITYETSAIKYWLSISKSCPMTSKLYTWSIVNVNYLQYIITGDDKYLKNKYGEYFIEPVVCFNDGVTYEKGLIKYNAKKYTTNLILKRIISNYH